MLVRCLRRALGALGVGVSFLRQMLGHPRIIAKAARTRQAIAPRIGVLRGAKVSAHYTQRMDAPQPRTNGKRGRRSVCSAKKGGKKAKAPRTLPSARGQRRSTKRNKRAAPEASAKREWPALI
jgi:hypothetical protein